MSQQKRGALTPEERGAIYRAQKADDFKSIVAHLLAAKNMIADSDLDESEILSVFSNADIPVFSTVVPDILATRYVRRRLAKTVRDDEAARQMETA